VGLLGRPSAKDTGPGQMAFSIIWPGTALISTVAGPAQLSPYRAGATMGCGISRLFADAQAADQHF
jgi:hypothetical protein